MSVLEHSYTELFTSATSGRSAVNGRLAPYAAVDIFSG